MNNFFRKRDKDKNNFEDDMEGFEVVEVAKENMEDKDEVVEVINENNNSNDIENNKVEKKPQIENVEEKYEVSDMVLQEQSLTKIDEKLEASEEASEQFTKQENKDVKSKIGLSFLSHYKKTNDNNEKKDEKEEKKKFNLEEGLKIFKSLTEKTVNNIESGISSIGDKYIEQEKNKEINEDLYNKVERLDRKFNELKLIIDDINIENTKSTKVDIILSESLNIDSLISKMEQSNNFMKQIAYYLKNEVNNVVANYIEENMYSVIQKTKYLKLEELNAQNKYNITLADLEEKINGKKKEIIILEKNIENKKQSISDLEKQIENENETYKNISEENNRQNIALSELRKNVEEEKKRTLGNLEIYMKEEKEKVDTEINKYKEDAKNQIKEGIELELEIQIEEKLKDFENLFKDLSLEVKEQILKKLLNK